jgi:D-alanyl-D-alanine carboxypeptidase
MTIMDDIPEALRAKAKAKPRSRLTLGFIFGWLLGLGAIIWLVGSWFLRPSPESPPIAASPNPSPTTQTSPAIENVLGHLPYAEAPVSELAPISRDGHFRLRKAAGAQFLQMQAAARANGVILTPISAFRTVEEQNYLFFGVKQQRNQETRKRAEVSAPPGYSEHHTGYAVDLGDGRAPGTNLSQTFDKTAAFRWLENNAAKYSFEMSFPLNNLQGVSYEPWHWRYVGDRQSLETFYKAKTIQNSKRENP